MPKLQEIKRRGSTYIANQPGETRPVLSAVMKYGVALECTAIGQNSFEGCPSLVGACGKVPLDSDKLLTGRSTMRWFSVTIHAPA
jgi:hypothetical protein